MAIVCNSQLLKDNGVDGHALCSFWDWCHGFGDKPCLQDGNATSDGIRHALQNERWIARLGITLEQIRECD